MLLQENTEKAIANTWFIKIVINPVFHFLQIDFVEESSLKINKKEYILLKFN